MRYTRRSEEVKMRSVDRWSEEGWSEGEEGG